MESKSPLQQRLERMTRDLFLQKVSRLLEWSEQSTVKARSVAKEFRPWDTELAQRVEDVANAYEKLVQYLHSRFETKPVPARRVLHTPHAAPFPPKKNLSKTYPNDLFRVK
jgi:hypothetical protein